MREINYFENYNIEHCYYCGEPAGTIDHVVPKSMIKTLNILEDKSVYDKLINPNRTLTVPSCLECNVLLSNSYQDTLADRKAELKRRLIKRYKKLLNKPEWTRTELNQLNGRLKEAVIIAIKSTAKLRARLAY